LRFLVTRKSIQARGRLSQNLSMDPSVLQEKQEARTSNSDTVQDIKFPCAGKEPEKHIFECKDSTAVENQMFFLQKNVSSGKAGFKFNN